MDVLIDTVRLAGPHAARLARVAAIELPRALERALGGVRDGRVDVVEVELDVDCAGVDDATLAAIWADAVRAEVVRRLGTAPPGMPDAVVGGRAPSPARAVGFAEALGAAQAWLASGEAARGLVPAIALHLGEHVEEAVHSERAVSDEAERAIIGLARRLTPALDRSTEWAAGSAVRSATAGTKEPTSGSQTNAPAEASPDGPPARASGPTAPTGALNPRGAARGREIRDAAARVAAVAQLAVAAEPAAGVLELDDLTAAAGLPLLYPWLADLCRGATDMHPGLDAARVRALALALLVDPDDPGLVRDPLVRLLAGDSAEGGESAPLERAAEVSEAADAVLASFAALLPGFASSSAQFVRQEWIQRLGLIDWATDPVRLTATAHPLDVVLPHLPYPLGLFRLPWSPPVAVRFRP